MPKLEPHFVHQTAILVFDASPNFLSKLATDAKGRTSEHLNLDLQATRSTGNLVVLQSPTGSTKVFVGQGRAQLQTQYFETYARPESWRERGDYSKRKLQELLELVAGAGAKLQFLGLTTVARIRSTDATRETLRNAAFELFGSNLLSEGQPCFDFSLRASRIVPPYAYSNVSADWYQTRSLMVPLPANQGFASLGVHLHDWDMLLEEEGVEFKFDRNNKYGLIDGKRDWTSDELLLVATQAMDEMPVSFERLLSSLESRTDSRH